MVMIMPCRVWEEKRRSPQEPVTSTRPMISCHALVVVVVYLFGGWVGGGWGWGRSAPSLSPPVVPVSIVQDTQQRMTTTTFEKNGEARTREG